MDAFFFFSFLREYGIVHFASSPSLHVAPR